MRNINLQSTLKEVVGPAVNILKELQNIDALFPLAAKANNVATIVSAAIIELILTMYQFKQKKIFSRMD